MAAGGLSKSGPSHVACRHYAADQRDVMVEDASLLPERDIPPPIAWWWVPVLGSIWAVGYCIIMSIGIDLRDRRIMPWEVQAALAAGWSRTEIKSPLTKAQFTAASRYVMPRVVGSIAIHVLIVGIGLGLESAVAA